MNDSNSKPDPLERIIRPIVEGQIRGFIKEHPSILQGVDWYKPRTDKSVTLVNSLSKRIIRDLLSQPVRERMVAALLDNVAETPPLGNAGSITGMPTGDLETDLESSVTGHFKGL